MQEKIEELNLDLEELTSLYSQSNRTNIKTWIQNKVDSTQKQIQTLKKQEEAQKQQQQNITTNSSEENTQQQQQQQYQKQQQQNLTFKTITNYSYDQEDGKVKAYIFLDLKDFPRENITHVFEKNAVEVKVMGLQKQNYLFKVPQLQEEIVPEKSKIIVKSNRITLVLVKKVGTKHWNSFFYKESIVKDKEKKPKGDKGGDVQADLMGLMKNMYESGDDEMKRTINKAWTESNDKKGGKDFMM